MRGSNGLHLGTGVAQHAETEHVHFVDINSPAEMCVCNTFQIETFFLVGFDRCFTTMQHIRGSRGHSSISSKSVQFVADFFT